MANWAITDYIIEGPLKTLLKIDDAIMHHQARLDSAENWEGNVLDALGIDFETVTPDGEGYYIRGFIEDHYLDDGVLHIMAEEAYGLTDFRKPLKEAFPDIKIYWNVESEDDDVFATNDVEGKYFVDRYRVDGSYNGYKEYEFFITKKSALQYISNITKGEVKTEEELEKFNEEHYDKDEYIHLREYDIVNE